MKDWIDLQRFEGGGGGGAGGGAGGAGSAGAGAAGGAGGAAGAAAAGTPAGQPAAEAGKAQPQKVMYGKQPAAQEAKAQEAQQAAPDLDAEFRELINGKYKEQYQRNTQNMINKRFAQTKGLEESNAKYRGVMEKLAARYGANPDDLDGISQAIDQDKKFLMEAADKAGMTVEQYRQMQALRAENERFRAMQRAEQERVEINQKIQQWRSEGEQVKAVYPQFDLDAEFGNPQFVELVKARVPMRQAYEVVHHDELMRGIAQYAATAAQQRTVANIQARGMRPTEGAAQSNPAGLVKSDVRKLTAEDREAVARRVMRGEKITFS